MKERPILFSGPMVRAILEGRKTMTRRASGLEKINLDPDAWTLVANKGGGKWLFRRTDSCTFATVTCPYGAPGDRLWVRETFFHGDGFYDDNPSVAWKNWHGLKDGERKATWIDYKADMTDERWSEFNDDPWNWNPSIFMPRWASRITLEVTAVRVERLREISEQDARAEGAKWQAGDGFSFGWRHDGRNGYVHETAGSSFCELWTGINGRESWDANPWVWVVEFRRVEK